jgi:hypothetical protein
LLVAVVTKAGVASAFISAMAYSKTYSAPYLLDIPELLSMVFKQLGGD